MFTDEQIKARTTLKLYRHGKWEASHTSLENVKKGFSLRDLGKDGTKQVDKICKGMIKSGWIMSHPTGYGLEISLNQRFSQELMLLIKNHFPDME